MKSEISKLESSKTRKKWDIRLSAAIYAFIIAMLLLSEYTMGLYGIVFLLASVISIGNAIYYGVVWKDLQKTERQGSFIFFSLLGVAGVMFYKFLPKNNSALEFFFGLYVGITTLGFMYKYKNWF